MSYSQIMTSIPKHVYFDKKVLQEERSLVFDQSWVCVGLSSQLPRPNMEWLFEIPGHSILVLRDQHGIIHACKNSCLHRGTKLRSPQKGMLFRRRNSWKGTSSTSIVCPYHGWNYDMTGQLCNVTKPQGFSYQTEESLQTYPTYEAAGLIWVALQKPRYSAEYMFQNIIPPLQRYHLEEMIPIEARDFYFPINWKIGLENALDYYHVFQVHQKSVNAHVSTLPSFKNLYWHNLQTLHIAPYKWRKRFDMLCSPKYGFTDLERSSLHKYFIFPNLVVNVLPYHLTIMQYWPVDEKNSILRYRFCRRKGRHSIEKMRAYASWLASRWILYEDVLLYQSIQQGIENSSQERHFLHEQEIGVAHFHQRLMEWRNQQDIVQSIV